MFSGIPSKILYSQFGQSFGFHGECCHNVTKVDNENIDGAMNISAVIGYCPVISIISGLGRSILFSMAVIVKLSGGVGHDLTYCFMITQVFRGVGEALQLGLIILLPLDIIFTIGRLIARPHPTLS